MRFHTETTKVKSTVETSIIKPFCTRSTKEDKTKIKTLCSRRLIFYSAITFICSHGHIVPRANTAIHNVAVTLSAMLISANI